MRRQREEEASWDEYENDSSESSSDDSSCDGSSQDEPSSEEEDLVVENKKGDSTFESLRDNDGRLQLGDEEHALKPTWRQDASGYLRRVRGCGSSATEKRECHGKES